MDRRNFLRLTATSAAVVALAPALVFEELPAAPVVISGTDFAALNSVSMMVWSRSLWASAREASFYSKMIGANLPLVPVKPKAWIALNRHGGMRSR